MNNKLCLFIRVSALFHKLNPRYRTNDEMKLSAIIKLIPTRLNYFVM
jgi:hypothetical protein